MDKPVYSVPFMNAVRQRAEGNGLVLCEVISWLTPDEWAQIRMMTPRQAKAILVAAAKAEAIVIEGTDDGDHVRFGTVRTFHVEPARLFMKEDISDGE